MQQAVATHPTTYPQLAAQATFRKVLTGRNRYWSPESNGYPQDIASADVAPNCGIGYRPLNGEVNAFERLQTVHGRISSCFARNNGSGTSAQGVPDLQVPPNP